MSKIIRNKSLLNKFVIVDGQPGCGKTMLSPIISSFKKVELFSFLFEFEYFYKLYNLKKIDKNTLNVMSKILIDLKLYQMMMGRETNFRYSDVSSVYQYHDPSKYFKRIFQEGDSIIPKKIIKEGPILNLATHDLMRHSDILFDTFNSKLVFIEVVRHPLYMLYQQTWNMKNIYGNVRDIHVYYNYKNNYIPYTAKNWENIYINSSPIEKAIFNIYNNIKENDKVRKKLIKKNVNFHQIVFEKFVKNPNYDLKILLKLMNTSFSSFTKKVLKDQKIPRKKIANSKELSIYKSRGWKAPKNNFNEKDEIEIRRKFAINEGARPKFINILDEISQDYESKYKY